MSKPDIVYNLKGDLASHGGADPLIVQRFLDYVRGIKEPNTSPLAARNAVATGVKAAESIRNGGRMKIVERYTSKV